MTPRMSVRARAREVYGEMAGAVSASVPNTPLPNPPPQGGREQTELAARAEPDLNARARELYENSAVPVHDIARLCGVTERTIYKYAAKGAWKKRYRQAASHARGKRTSAPGCAPAKGAGGRFIRRADIGKPYATGLKATDATGRERALDACASAARLGRLASARAEAEARQATHLRAIAATTQAVSDLNAFRRRFAGVLDKAKRDAQRAALASAVNAEPSKELPRPEKPRWPPLSLVVALEGLHVAAVQASLRVWQAAMPRA